MNKIIDLFEIKIGEILYIVMERISPLTKW